MGDVSLAPERVVKVVTDAGHTSVSLNLTLWWLKGSWAVVGNNGLGGVDQGQSLRDGILGQAVLASKNSASLLEDETELSCPFLKFVVITLVFKRPDPAKSSVESRVDSIKRNASVRTGSGNDERTSTC